ncbi:MAG TPA: FUN14 domain-containing protein [Nitrososphaeraceae archaeon]|nr:FUN14 domain-containing protein [Nitrososphaeraceae archaeon]
MVVDNISSISAVVGGGFFGGILLGYALKKVVKLVAVVIGLFVAGLAYLQYQQVASINWTKVEGTISTIANATTNTFNDFNIETLAMTNLGIPLTGSVSAGFAIGFMKG